MSKGAELLKRIKDEEVAYVDLRFTDPRGRMQHVTAMSHIVDEDWAEEGWMFDGSSISGWKTIDQSDMKLLVDPDTAFIDPFYAEKTLAVFCTRARHRSTSATRAPRRSRPSGISPTPASATSRTGVPRPSSSCSTTSASRSP